MDVWTLSEAETVALAYLREAGNDIGQPWPDWRRTPLRTRSGRCCDPRAGAPDLARLHPVRRRPLILVTGYRIDELLTRSPMPSVSR